MSELISEETTIKRVTIVELKTPEERKKEETPYKKGSLSDPTDKKQLVGKTGMKFARIQSPSSINTYKQCPRKYYYHYIEKLPSDKSIHLTRGSIAHQVLEDFFKLDINKIPEENVVFVLKIFIHDKFKQEWEKNKEELNSLGMDQTMLDYYYYETREMLNRWYQVFVHKLAEEMKTTSLNVAFKKLTPRTEEFYQSEIYGVRGYIDAVHNEEEGVTVVDYKTSKRRKMSDAYKLQLAIYALMHEEKHGFLPKKAGIFFLKHGAFDTVEVNEELVQMAKLECELIHTNTQTKEKDDYPKKPGPLCKWRTGACTFYENCFGCK